MKDFKCRNALNFGVNQEIYECGSCGNHVCRECAVKSFYVCPNCFGRLYRIS